jgi:ribonuclease HI
MKEEVGNDEEIDRKKETKKKNGGLYRDFKKLGRKFEESRWRWVILNSY